MPNKILLIDGFSILNRAFYALPLLSTKDGEYTNAVYGFMNMFFRFCDEEKPDFVTVAFDLPQPTFRHEQYGAYKGTRKGMPDELRAQVPMLKNLLEKMQIHVAECAGYEADDVIGTLAAKAVAQGVLPVIVSGDRDLLQLATETVRIRLPKTKAGKTEVEDYLAADVVAKYGVSPQAFIDVKALMGDVSDNVPGVPGIGEVTATKIIAAFGSLDNALENIADIKPKKAAENLETFKDQAMLSRMLVTIVQDAPVELCLAPLDKMWSAEAQEEVRRLELKSLYKRFDTAQPQVAARQLSFDIIKDPNEAVNFFASIVNAPTAVYFLWDDNALVGLAVCNGESTKYIAADMQELSLFSTPGINDILELAKPWLQSRAPKIVYDYKYEAAQLHRHGITFGGVKDDVMLAAYVLDCLSPNRTPNDLISVYLNEHHPTLKDILDNKGKRGKDRRLIKDVQVETAAKYAANTADALFRMQPILADELEKNNQTDLYNHMELPVAQTLLEMELAGFEVDLAILEKYGEALNQPIEQSTAAIYELAGEQFNINSPAQLGAILFEKLGLQGGKKTTHGFSTAADVLDKLADKHPIIPLVQDYRAHAKLKSTYVDGLIPLIDPVTSRVHSTFNQTLTATGRLSSTEPNLQNIPVRMPLGRELRKAFVPKDGCVLVTADYSQIELRLLAHMSGDETLITAFKEEQDIHRLTASQVLGIPLEDVTPAQRGDAKAVNFGIIYGISAFKLSEDLKIHIKEAERYIAGYFAKYPGVKQYLDNVIENARRDGYAATIFNRRRNMAELKSPNFNTRAYGERVAMNMPLQGSAADIIKIAMVNVANHMRSKGLKAQIILQVHDELLLEVPKEETLTVKDILKTEMERTVKLDVPLVVDVSEGDSWYATK